MTGWSADSALQAFRDAMLAAHEAGLAGDQGARAAALAVAAQHAEQLDMNLSDGWPLPAPWRRIPL